MLSKTFIKHLFIHHPSSFLTFPVVVAKRPISGADPGFQVRGGALKIIAPSGARCENFWGISCIKITILRKKKSYFLQF